MSTMSTPELSRIKSVRVPRRMYVSKFQRYGGAVIVVVLAVAVGAGILPKADRQRTRGALVAVGFLCGYLARQLRSPVRVRVNLEWNEESRSVRAVRRFTKLLGGGIEA